MFDIEKAVLAAGTELAFGQGECLFRKAQQPDYVFYLKYGSVVLTDDDESVAPRCIADQACFLGLSELLLDHPHRETAIVRDTSTLLAFERPVLEALMAQHTAVRRYFMRKLCDHLHTVRAGFE
jgi:CRP-like cAMP-binding protein